MPITPDIDTLLAEMTAAGASDLHLKVGRRPLIRVDGLLRELDGHEALTAAELDGTAGSASSRDNQGCA